jgi:hypothetical protein
LLPQLPALPTPLVLALAVGLIAQLLLLANHAPATCRGRH